MPRTESPPALVLNHGLTFADLFTPEGLERIDRLFLTELRASNIKGHDTLLAWRAGTQTLSPLQVSELLLAAGPVLEDFIIKLFNIHEALEEMRQRTLTHDPVFHFKKFFVQRRARRRLLKKEEFENFAELDSWLSRSLQQAGIDDADRELATAKYGEQLLKDDKAHAEGIEKLTRWCLRALTVPEGKAAVKGWVSFRLPEGIDHQKLVPIIPVNDDLGRLAGPPERLWARDGFKLTDPRMNAREIQNEIHYCIYCHDHDGDFCSKGFPEKKGAPDKGLKVNPLGVTLTGCPLDEKISEMHLLKKSGHAIAALAMITVDNPMCAATGHRICNDCMKACIYQKQDPVNIPQTETRILTDVLDLPWGVEIYDLLIRWNPLRPKQWLPKPYNGLKILVLGMGPAGFTLAHHMLMEGFAVVGAEGLKIEALPEKLVSEPIRDFTVLEESLDTRIMAGFGGVAEYGITNRWDKNFLKLIYLSLSRRQHFQVFGGVRFGGTLTVEDAWELGFDHIAICIGAGLPQALPVPGSLAPGMRQANDFLMALQLTGAAKHSSLANLQVRLPAVVIGGGLTGVDTATEIQAYYIVQVEKMLERYEMLSRAKGEPTVRAGLDAASLNILDEFLTHGRAVRAERHRAKQAGEQPDFVKLIRQWGGVTITYRKGMNQSPAYTRNHEEIIKAFEEGIYYAEGLDPKEARVDPDGQVQALVAKRLRPDDNGKWNDTGEEVTIPARAILVATGARPNVAYEFEHKGHFHKERGHYQTHHDLNGKLEPVPVAPHCKVSDFGPFTSYRSKHGHRVSFLGDTHPVFHGSVVKAIASGLRTYPKILASLGSRINQKGDIREYHQFRLRMEELLAARVESVKRLTPSVVELKVRAPMAAKRFKAGQFFRLQNFETRSAVVDGTRLQTEALAMTGARVDPATGIVSLVVIERGASSRLVAALQPGDPVALMGPTGVRATIPHGGETILFIGGRHGAAHVQSTGLALREKGNRVLFVGCFDTAQDVFCQDEIEQAADTVLWITAEGLPITPRRPQDHSVTAPVLEGISQYAAGKLGHIPIRLQDVTRVQVVGSNRLVRLIRDGRAGELALYLTKNQMTTASISTPMQCCLKGVCSQCLQWQRDPATGKRTKAVFGCSWQDQPLDIVDLDNLDERLSQNRVQEHLTNQWLDFLLLRHNGARA
ncbi:MAG: FAD-dependent oxidoreductase [Gammaproteobacteria bacterium]|nr:FAD-dependent oxidoreductase [Gammaproteobacteria bacterium]